MKSNACNKPKQNMLKFEPLKAEYIKEIAAIEKEAFFDIAWSEEMLASEISNSQAAYFVLTDDSNQVLAYGGFHNIAGEGHITNIAVKQSFRKQGFGSAVLELMIEFAKASGIAFLTLEVKASNIPAQSLYAKFGFETVGLRKNYYGGKEDAILMTLHFDPH